MIANEVRIFTASEGAWQLELELLQPSLALGLPSLMRSMHRSASQVTALKLLVWC